MVLRLGLWIAPPPPLPPCPPRMTVLGVGMCLGTLARAKCALGRGGAALEGCPCRAGCLLHFVWLAACVALRCPPPPLLPLPPCCLSPGVGDTPVYLWFKNGGAGVPIVALAVVYGDEATPEGCVAACANVCVH